VLFLGGLGLPLPEEAAILGAGALASEDIVTWWLALPVCVAGVLSGDVVLYWAGHHFGEHILDWRPVRLVLPPAREERLRAAFKRHGVKILFTARHVMGLRAATFLTAGIARIPFGQFIAVDAGAVMVGVPTGFALAYFFTDQLQRIRADIHRVEGWAILLLLVAVAVWIAIAAYRSNRAV